ncbi:uncharacterized protein LOC120917715 isoform X1 [Rana temporaria]|uniref:uncharacterized protein LOC120917715 isoform X1 n=1 Tax=Rana temporaria TaxID=8407 RepID=UPI001AAD3E3D|nr:uncharacterized protein LOC120917715 isoform X1 [Rana temporaria]XP_040185125.1 uncharacterized protein LOC120917715 isoform X1 [Rana temporaria]
MEKEQGHLDSGQQMHDQLAVDTALSTLVVILVYIVVKVSVDGIRQWRARVSILVVGAGPVGLTAALVAVRSRKVLNLTILDERTRTALFCRPQQIALDPRSVKFLLTLGVDFDNIEGCWDNDHFFTKIGVFQEHLLSILEQRKQTLDIRILLGTKFTEEYMRKMSQDAWPRILIVADGSCGESSFLLGVNSEYIVESCNAYGANAAFERLDQRQVPTPEIRAHNLHFDLSAYGIDVASGGKDTLNKPGFHLKIYGTFRNRYMALACPASDAKVVRFLRYTPNSAVMKNIFHQSFNAYKADIEPRMSDLSFSRLQCSRRLFEIMLSHRRVTSAFIEGINVVVTLEGEAARVLNFDTGCGVNLGLRGLESSEEFIYKVAIAVDQRDVFEALSAKIKHSKQVVEDFKFSGLAVSVFE